MFEQALCNTLVRVESWRDVTGQVKIWAYVVDYFAVLTVNEIHLSPTHCQVLYNSIAVATYRDPIYQA